MSRPERIPTTYPEWKIPIFEPDYYEVRLKALELALHGRHDTSESAVKAATVFEEYLRGEDKAA